MTASDPVPGTAVVGLQWGDEGKGKIVDLLARRHDAVVRYNGGANAGHTVVVGGERYALHLVPSGILVEGCRCVIGNGVVVDPEKLASEIDGLRDRGVAVGGNLVLSDRAHVVMPYHKAEDAAVEVLLAGEDEDQGDGSRAIGTTRRGIGPAYADKVRRSTAVRVADLLDERRLRKRLESVVRVRGAALAALDIPAEDLDPDILVPRLAEAGRRLAPHVADTTWHLHDLWRDGRRLLFEGANASLLDVDHGTYPFVTSSHSSTLGICPGTGLPAAAVGEVVGIMKAYSTRVGAGPFPTELANEIGDRIRAAGNEYGTTTGRPRRCGWLDLVAVRYAAMINGASSIAIMLLDVLSGFDRLRVCTAYRRPDGSVTDRFVPDAAWLDRVEPLYEELPGWSEAIDASRDWHELPAAARSYVDRVSEFLGVPVDIVSVGPDRAQTLVREPGMLAVG